MTRNDTLWKGLIEDIFPYFIPFFLPEHAHLFDLNKPVEFLDKELQQINPAPEAETAELRFVDKLVKVHTVDGEEKWVLIHIEVQGYNDAKFAQRMFHYFYRILDRYGVPVTAITIFTDSNPAFHPNTYTYDFAGTKYTYQFNTYKVLAQNETKLADDSNNPFAIAILTVLLEIRKKKQRLDDENLFSLKLALVKQLRSRKFPKKTIDDLFSFLNRHVNFASPETAIKFEKEIALLTNQQSPMGIQEMILEMTKQEAKAETTTERNTFFVENLFRSTDFTNEKIAAIAGVSVEFVQEIKHKLS